MSYLHQKVSLPAQERPAKALLEALVKALQEKVSPHLVGDRRHFAEREAIRPFRNFPGITPKVWNEVSMKARWVYRQRK